MLAEKPPMGWRSWNTFRTEISDKLMLAQVHALKHSGLLAAGYAEIGIDDGWQACTGADGSFHDTAGHPIVNETIFPDMLSMTRQAHALGVQMGFYMNNCYCHQGEIARWPHGNVEQDVAATVAWEFDGLKIDGCGPAHDISAWTSAVEASGRPVVVENCGDNHDTWSPPLPEELEICDFQFYRISNDIAPHYNSVMWNLQKQIPFQDVAKPMSRPGCWAYPDMLQVGWNPFGALTVHESRAHFAAWCVTSSPLVLGFDLTNETLLTEMLPIVANSRAIEVNQVWNGHPGRLVRNATSTVRLPVPHGAPCRCCDDMTTCKDVWDAPHTQVWAKPMTSMQVAVVVLNHSDKDQSECFKLQELGLSGPATVTDVWTGKVEQVDGDEHCCDLASHDSCFVTVLGSATLV